MTEFEKIYRTHFNDVYLFIKRLSKDEKLAEDITSETFFKALKSLNSFNGSCSVRVWLCQIAKNCYISHLRKSNKTISIEGLEDCIIDEKIDIEQLIANADISNRIHSVVHELSEPYKEVFSLRVFAELSFKQIGEIFNKSDNWACVTFHRAKSQIRTRLEEEE